MYGCESCIIKKAEHWRIDAFELWCWRRLLLSLGHQGDPIIGKTDAEAEAPILWPFDVKKWLIWKDSDAGKYWRQEEKGMTEYEVVGWHHRLNGPTQLNDWTESLTVISDSATPWNVAPRLPCPSATPRIYSNSCSLSQWCHSTTSYSVVPFSHLQSFPASGSFYLF